MKYSIDPGAWSPVFALPGLVVDRYIKLAGKSQLRVILYLLRHAGREMEDGELSDALALHPDEVAQALDFWIEAGVILPPDGRGGLQEKSAAESALKEPSIQPPPEKSGTPPKDAPAARPHALTRAPMNDPAVIARRISESDEIKTLVGEAEVILGKNLRAWEADILISLHDADDMPVDVIIMILHYAAAQGKTTLRYVEKMAQSWIEEGIDTIERAEHKIRMIQASANAWNKVCSLFRIESRKPSTREGDYALRWLEEWKLSDGLLLLAYDRCVDATGKMKFAYMNKILSEWHEKGYTTAKQAENGETPDTSSKKGAASKGKTKPSYDLEAFEQMLINGELPEKREEKDEI